MQPTNGKPYLQIQNFKAQGMPQAIDFELNQKDICMISGVSGSGKSQFFKALADLIEHQGQAQLIQQTMEQCTPDYWRSQVMYFPAETAWWDDQVALHFDTLPTTDMLQRIGLKADLLNANPDSLSSGEKQRLALLRGLQYQPKVLLLDEITANLDPESEQLVEKMLLNYIQHHQIAVVWITNKSQQTARLANKVMTFTETAISTRTVFQNETQESTEHLNAQQPNGANQ